MPVKGRHQFLPGLARGIEEQQDGRSALAAASLPAGTNGTAREKSLVLAYASETGFIEGVAELTRRDLESAGITVRLTELDELDATALVHTTAVLFMASTTGNGDAPFAAARFREDVMVEPVNLSHLRFGLLCAGDLDYEIFCGFGHRLRDWLLASGARPLFESIDVDCEDDRAVEQWRHQVMQTFSVVTGRCAR